MQLAPPKAGAINCTDRIPHRDLARKAWVPGFLENLSDHFGLGPYRLRQMRATLPCERLRSAANLRGLQRSRPGLACGFDDALDRWSRQGWLSTPVRPVPQASQAFPFNALRPIP